MKSIIKTSAILMTLLGFPALTFAAAASNDFEDDVNFEVEELAEAILDSESEDAPSSELAGPPYRSPGHPGPGGGAPRPRIRPVVPNDYCPNESQRLRGQHYLQCLREARVASQGLRGRARLAKYFSTLFACLERCGLH